MSSNERRSSGTLTAQPSAQHYVLPAQQANHYQLSSISASENDTLPSYSTTRHTSLEKSDTSSSSWNPKYWSRFTWITIIVVITFTLLFTIVGAVEGSKAQPYPDYFPLKYQLKDTFEGKDFFDKFDYSNGRYPADGFVRYATAQQSRQMNLTFASRSTAVLRVDNTQTKADTGRYSARIYSKTQYSSGLFIFDIIHIPYGCASWPMVSLSDPYNLLNNGEIDVIEPGNRGLNGNQMTLHTSKGCSMADVKREETGSPLHSNCWNETDNNTGCGVRGPKRTSGPEFNTRGGGVYAVELRDAGIRMWFFPRDKIPVDISSSNKLPNPASWGEALADFPNTECNINNHFRNLSITADIGVCGYWPGENASAQGPDRGCPGNCAEIAANNPSAFDEAYWQFKSFEVYTAVGKLRGAG